MSELNNPNDVPNSDNDHINLFHSKLETLSLNFNCENDGNLNFDPVETINNMLNGVPEYLEDFSNKIIKNSNIISMKSEKIDKAIENLNKLDCCDKKIIQINKDIEKLNNDLSTYNSKLSIVNEKYHEQNLKNKLQEFTVLVDKLKNFNL